jgi:L-2-hydroxyglutarate oxidase LhgO
VPYERCGKVIVAVSENELPILENIFQRGQENGVACTLVDGDRLRELEPHAAGIRAIHVPEAGIVNYTEVSKALQRCILEQNGVVLTGFEVTHIYPGTDNVTLDSATERVSARYVINCAGLYTDKIARLAGIQPGIQIVPFRGEYFTLVPQAQGLCRSLIYPVPDPDFPCLGVHFTKRIGGGIECGPNAVLALAREGYTRTTWKSADLLETFRYSGFQRLARRHWRQGFAEFWRSFNKKAFVRALQRLVPEIREDHLVPAPAGVRAQALDPDGKLVDDFLIRDNESMTHVLNAPSPAATASLQIAHTIVDRLSNRL